MKTASFDPQWYIERRAELAQLADELKADPNKTWGHPMDWVLAVSFIVVLTLAFVGVFG